MASAEFSLADKRLSLRSLTFPTFQRTSMLRCDVRSGEGSLRIHYAEQTVPFSVARQTSEALILSSFQARREQRPNQCRPLFLSPYLHEASSPTASEPLFP